MGLGAEDTGLEAQGRQFLLCDLGELSGLAKPWFLFYKTGLFGGFSDLKPKKHLARYRHVVSLTERSVCFLLL